MKTFIPWSKAFTSIACAMLVLVAFAPLTAFSAKIEVPFENFGDNPNKLDDIVKNQDWLLVLGRAFFFDQNMGSDGGACANCHFSAGADNRLTGQMNPAFRAAGGQDRIFGCTEGTDCITNPGTTGSGKMAGPEYTFVEEDYPFRQFVDDDVTDRNAEIRINSNDIHSSAGSFDAKFIRAFYGNEKCGKPKTDTFYKTTHYGKTLAKRAVEPRNTATVVNTGMNFTNFWDGRANNMFNGVGVFGMSDIVNDENKRLIEINGKTASLTYLTLRNASLASLSVGPILDNLEMSCDGRTFADVARKILYTRPLAKQRVAATDSTFGHPGKFGDIRGHKGRGLRNDLRYYKLIKLAFKNKWWKGKGLWKIKDGELIKIGKHSRRKGHTQMEINFPMFWGLAVQKYQHSLISDQSKFDTAEAAGCFDTPPGPPGGTPPKLAGCIANGLWTQPEEDGRQAFNGFGRGQGGCIACHGGNMFTNAAMDNDGSFNIMTVGAGIADEGFQNTGANLIAQDLGRYATDNYGVPLSFAMQLVKAAKTGIPPIDPLANECNIAAGFGGGARCTDGTNPDNPIDWATQAVEIGGAMKSPSMRNVGLTPPYFHYGGYSNLIDILDFYDRGGSRRDLPAGCTACIPQGPPTFACLQPVDTFACTGDSSGSGPLGTTPYAEIDITNAGTNVPGIINSRNMTQTTKNNIVTFLLSLTDQRVACDADVFDHPELVIFTGSKAKDRNRDGRADDVKVRIPAVGIEGYAYTKPELCIPNVGDLFEPAMGNRTKDGRKKATTM